MTRADSCDKARPRAIAFHISIRGVRFKIVPFNRCPISSKRFSDSYRRQFSAYSFDIDIVIKIYQYQTT